MTTQALYCLSVCRSVCLLRLSLERVQQRGTVNLLQAWDYELGGNLHVYTQITDCIHILKREGGMCSTNLFFITASVGVRGGRLRETDKNWESLGQWFLHFTGPKPVLLIECLYWAACTRVRARACASCMMHWAVCGGLRFSSHRSRTEEQSRKTVMENNRTSLQQNQGTTWPVYS